MAKSKIFLLKNQLYINSKACMVIILMMVCNVHKKLIMNKSKLYEIYLKNIHFS